MPVLCCKAWYSTVQQRLSGLRIHHPTPVLGTSITPAQNNITRTYPEVVELDTQQSSSLHRLPSQHTVETESSAIWPEFLPLVIFFSFLFFISRRDRTALFFTVFRTSHREVSSRLHNTWSGHSDFHPIISQTPRTNYSSTLQPYLKVTSFEAPLASDTESSYQRLWVACIFTAITKPNPPLCWTIGKSPLLGRPDCDQMWYRYSQLRVLAYNTASRANRTREPTSGAALGPPMDLQPQPRDS